MRELPVADHRFPEPTRVVIEASWEVIAEQDLDTLDGEQYDSIDAVTSIDVSRGEVTFTTVRTLAAWKRGEENAGRGTWTFPRSAIASIHVP
jgi:hypothetical protein